MSEQTKAVILVEGESDRIALETLAARLGRDLATEGVDVVAMSGVTNIAAALERLGSTHRIVVLCDQREAEGVRRAAARAGIVDLRVEVCVVDLEDELIRALSPDVVERVIDAAGDLGSFRTLQQMPAHRANTREQQLRRFIGTKSGRKAKYARLLVNALDLARVPQPLRDVIA
jgi:predicted ATP-dependent endonuclease of OLD family